MHGSFDNLDEFYSEMPSEVIDVQQQQPHSATRSDTGDSDDLQNDGEESDGSSNLVGSFRHGSRMNNDEGWETVEDDANYLHSDEGVGSHQLEGAGYERRWIEITGHGIVSGLDLSRLLRNLIGATARCENMIPDNYNYDTNTPGMHTPGSPSSMDPEPGSGERTIESSMHFPPRTESPTAYVAFMGPEPYFSPTPANCFTSAPIWPTWEPSLLPNYALSLDFVEGESSDDDT